MSLGRKKATPPSDENRKHSENPDPESDPDPDPDLEPDPDLDPDPYLYLEGGKNKGAHCPPLEQLGILPTQG